MKESKAVSVTKHELKQRLYDVYINRVKDDRRSYTFCKDIGCQYDVKKTVNYASHNTVTTRKRDMYFSGVPKQVYAYHGTRSVTDVGVGSVKALQRKRVRRIYLPETDDRGIGSEDLSAFVTRRPRPIPRSYYDQKKTSSKCVGGIIEYNTGCVLNEKLSPIVQTRSGATSPSDWKINAEVASNTIGKDMVTNTTQVEPEIRRDVTDNTKNTDNVEASNIKANVKNSQEATCSKDKDSVGVENSPPKAKRTNQVDRVVSSDSLVQHVHNLENPSDYKQSRTSMDPMENKLEREYRKIFSRKGKDKRPNEKPMADLKSASVLRRRFEALRRGAVKKEESKRNAVLNQESSQAGVPIKKDVSIASDPPSLEGRSFSNTKTFSPFHFKYDPEKPICKPSTSPKKSLTDRRDAENSQWGPMGNDDSDSQGVKGMFKLWGKTFNLEEDNYKKRSTPIPSHQRVNTFNKQPDKKAELKLEKTVKKDGRKFFFFKKKSKEKSKPYKSKKGLTAGRCEVGDGLTIKIDGNTFNAVESKKKIQISEELLRKQWLHKYLTHAIESKNSVQIRWNNKTYATSSSTIFELMDTVYQDAGIVFRSRSEVTTGDSSFYRSRTQHVNFAHQEIEAWMIPKTVVDPPKQKRKKIKDLLAKDNTEVRMSAQKWFIDKAKAFSRKIEVVLHTKHVVHAPKESSSEYLRIDIPKGFFVESSSDEKRKHSSDEEVFKIVEYETEFTPKKTTKDMATGDHPAPDIELKVPKSQNLEKNILETIIKGPAALRDVVIQGSDVNVPKRCDVIGVGIITQRDLRDIRKPILKIQDYLSDEESDSILIQKPKTCEFAESYLQDYYRHWTPLGMDLFSWCVSDTHLRCESDNSEGSYFNQGDGSKSCPNIYDDFHTSAIISSSNACDSRFPTQILPDYDEIKPADIEIFKCKWLKKLKAKKPTVIDCGKRVLPKDSLEVFKRRKIYASSDKSKWTCSSYCDIKPYSVPSIEDKGAQGLAAELSKSTVGSRGMDVRQRPCRKHVSMKEDGTYEYVSKSEGSPAGILMFRGVSGCDVCKEAAGICPKHATVDPVSCEIPDPSCRPMCIFDANPPCNSVDSLPTQVTCREPPPEPMKPPCLTAANHEKGPPCQECRSSMEETSVDNSSQDQSTPTDKTAPTEIDVRKIKKSSMDKRPSKHLPTESYATTSSNMPRKQGSILCPHFPPCRKSQSCQKSVEAEQPCPETCPKIPCCDTQKPCGGSSCIVKINIKNREEKGKFVNRRLSPKESEQFPWPLKSQKSDQSTRELSVCPSSLRVASPKPRECHDDCPLSPKYSAQTVAPRKGKAIECTGKCGRASETKLPKTPPCIPIDPDECTGPCASPPKMKKCTPVRSSVSTGSKDCTGPCASPLKRTKYIPVTPSVSNESNDCKGPCASPPKKKECPAIASSTSNDLQDCKGPCAPPKKRQCTPVASPIPVPANDCKGPCATPPKKKQSAAVTSPIPLASTDCTGPCASPVRKKKSEPVTSSSIGSTCCRGPCVSPPREKKSAPVTSPIPSKCTSPCASPPKKKKNISAAPTTPISSPPPKKKQAVPVSPPITTAATENQGPVASPPKENSPSILPVESPETKTVSVPKPKLKSKLSKKKKISKECTANEEYVDERGVIHLNSRETISIRTKEPTPSTEEIREAMNIKVKDDDGNTLYERIDYRKSCKPCRPSLLEDMYKTSDVNRCSTPITIKNVQTSHEREKLEEVDNKSLSTASVANLVEIQFKLKISQADKTTELSIGKNKHNNNIEQIKKSEISTLPQDVFVFKDDDNLCAKPSPKNDVNIRIVIKNFKPKSDRRKSCKYDEDFSQNISDKFHTVSTGYSDLSYPGNKLDNVFSVHRATVDLTTSNEKSKTQTEINENKSKLEFTDEPSKITAGSHETKLSPSASKLETDNFDEKSFILCKNLNIENGESFQSYLPDQEIRTSLYTDSEDQDNVDLAITNADSDFIIEKPRSKEQKKELLKKVMEKAHNTKNKSKHRMKKLRDMLKVILTSDSSGHDEMVVTSNELLKDVTFASLRPGFFDETDSIKTSYNIGSMLSLGEESESKYYPTKEQNSECSKSEEEPVGNEIGRGCMCNTFAERLNLCGLGDGRCGCRGKQTRSEQTSCDITTENTLFMNVKTTELVDVETQQSKYFSSRASASCSLRSGTTSTTFNNRPTVSAHFEQIAAQYKTRDGIKERLPKMIIPVIRDKSKEKKKKSVNRNISLNLSEEDRAVLLKATPTNVSTDVEKSNNVKGKPKFVRKPHILQSYATKKAVLEIYAEKTLEEDGEHTVAKLPKFVYDRESEICRYQQRLCHFDRVCKRNIVMMSVER